MRTEQHHTSGPTHVRVYGDLVTVHADPATTTTSAVLTPLSDGDEIARDRIDGAQITSERGEFAVRLPAQRDNAFDGGTTIIGGGATVIQSRSTEQVNIVSGNGRIITNGAMITAGKGVTQVTPSGAVDMTIYAPAGSSLTAETTAGDITTHGELADVEVETRSGNIRLDRTTGVLAADASSGNIAVSRAYGHAALEASSGNIAADVLHQGGSLRVSSGSVRACLAGAAGLKARVSSGNIELTTSDPASEEYLGWRVSSGNVRVNGSRRLNGDSPGRSW